MLRRRNLLCPCLSTTHSAVQQTASCCPVYVPYNLAVYLAGFPASEKARLVKAWVMSLLFAKNSASAKFESDILNYFMLLLNLVVVVVVIGKAALFPTGDPVPNSETGEVESKDQMYFDLCSILVVVLPIISGVLLTMNNAFNPVGKYNALRWASIAVESEIYEYRCRAVAYSATSASPQWSFDGEEGEDAEMKEQTTASKKFVSSLQSISGAVRGESQLMTTAMTFFKTEESEELVNTRVCFLLSAPFLHHCDAALSLTNRQELPA